MVNGAGLAMATMDIIKVRCFLIVTLSSLLVHNAILYSHISTTTTEIESTLRFNFFAFIRNILLMILSC